MHTYYVHLSLLSYWSNGGCNYRIFCAVAISRQLGICMHIPNCSASQFFGAWTIWNLYLSRTYRRDRPWREKGQNQTISFYLGLNPSTSRNCTNLQQVAAECDPMIVWEHFLKCGYRSGDAIWIRSDLASRNLANFQKCVAQGSGEIKTNKQTQPETVQ